MIVDPDLVAALARSVLPDGIAVAACDPRVMPSKIEAAEDAAIRTAVPRRRTEFHAGRAAARAALSMLDIAPQPILTGPDRAPVWPAGVTGSISHSRTACAAAVGLCRDWRGIGIDLEEATPLDPALLPEICTRSERAWLSTLGPDDQAHMAKLLFSAKEAAYKAQYQVTRTLFGFDTFEIRVDRDASRFRAVFQTSHGPFAAGDILRGRFRQAAGLLVTGVAVRQSGTARTNNS
ncbi:4'-phosphopantetheinyl transferase superfamily protein [Sulfitobacter sp. F26169L]|uniref:4'-phosphopantetheinyl transferase family protein n=1 Tax=Sulfitobacter sp. F26169L TaxID=2996015 RepID=UPI002260EA7C|nr:4'-phosphopantetheinyl transferase superfamily protein [Sulfitobacter sp. F26169L]MCX7566453.1 4'-phosphopantetheinyl transferase superfamily protein [Sulfitobacter sp. F26169L]